jgi:transposase
MNFTPQQVWLAIEPVDMRLGIEGLSLRVQESLGKAPCDGSAYAFCNKRGNRLKLLVWDGAGVWLAQRRLHRGRFTWPRAGEAVCTLGVEQWRWLTTGVDWQRLSAEAPSQWKVWRDGKCFACEHGERSLDCASIVNFRRYGAISFSA